jgi:hypothetical protein
MEEPMHSQGSVCLDARIGRLLPEYNRDAILPPEAKYLAIEVKLAVEAHLMRCAFCRGQLNEHAQLSFETTLILSGRFIHDPLIRQRRLEKVRKLIEGAFTEEDYQESAGGTWLEISEEEREALRRFLGRG